MSDERDSAGAAGDGSDTDATGGQTAVVTQPLRPTGKRSRQRVADDTNAEESDDTGETATKSGAGKNGSGTKAKTDNKQSGPSRNPIIYLVTFLKQVVAELRKVIWPNRKQMVNYTSVVLVFLVFMVTLIGLVDRGLSELIVLVFGGPSS